MRLDGSVVATVPGELVDQHAVGAALVAASDGSGKAWTVDASGVVRAVAPAAAKLMTPLSAAAPLILDSTTAVIGCGGPSNSCTAEVVNLITAAVRPLLTVPGTTGQAAMALGVSLTVLDISTDRNTVWLRKINSASLTTGQLEVVGIDLGSGSITSQSMPKALLDDRQLAIARDGQSVAGQEEFGTNSSNQLIRHLHVISRGSGVDSDLQGTAPYVGGWPPPGPPAIMFAPDGATVAWWGDTMTGNLSHQINVAALGGHGRNLWGVDDNGGRTMVVAVYWVNSTTLVAQTDSTSTPGSFTGANLQAFTIDATTGALKTLPPKLHYLAGIIN